MPSDEQWMRHALEQANAADAAGEVPVGAVLVKDGVIVATGRNTPRASHDPSAHAEINALRAGSAALGNHRLDGCELFVTLEPCAMCAGAILHARLARVVYGARDPKTGAAGSVVDLFGLPQLNHRTRVQGQVLSDACGGLLQAFFQRRRLEMRQASMPLRDDALRTPEERFAGLIDQGVRSFWSVGGALQRGWRMHWLDTSANGPSVSVLCLHGFGQWGYYFRSLMSMKKIRFIVPDLIGFGRSDKPKRETVHAWSWHRDVLLEWAKSLETGPMLLACAEGTEPFAELLLAEGTDLFAATSVISIPDAKTGDVSDIWRAPFPDRGHEAALRALGRTDAASSGPSLEQAEGIANGIAGWAADTMGYCRP